MSRGIWNLVAKKNHTGGRCKGAHKNLSFSAQVPELHLEGRREGKRDAQQDGNLLQQNPNLSRGAKGTAKERHVDVDWVETGENRCDNAADDKCEDDQKSPLMAIDCKSGISLRFAMCIMPPHLP